MIYIIGVGGVGSWLAHAMVRLAGGGTSLVLVDGDTLEKKNLDRQMFSEADIGKNKAAALSERIGTEWLEQWYSPYIAQHTRHDWLFGCVDNNPARKSILQACDLFGCSAIIGANETHSSEAYIYKPEWKGHPTLDPRITYAPKIMTDDSGNPEAASIGCVGEAQELNRQLVTANLMASSLAAHLFVVWGMEARKAKPETQEFMPVRLYQNLTRNGCVLRGPLDKPESKGEQQHE